MRSLVASDGRLGRYVVRQFHDDAIASIRVAIDVGRYLVVAYAVRDVPEMLDELDVEVIGRLPILCPSSTRVSRETGRSACELGRLGPRSLT